MANCNHNIVSMPFTICCCFLILFTFFIFIAPNKVKEDSILSEHFSSVSNVVVVFLHCAVSYIGSVLQPK